MSTVSTAHFRMTEDGGAWIAMEDGWHTVNEGAARAESEAVRLIREEMGKEECRDKYMGTNYGTLGEKNKGGGNGAAGRI